MNTTETIRARRSVRKYQPGMAIPKEHLDLMLEAAMCAPSACNSRPWEFVVVESTDIRKQITKIHPYCRSLPDASLGIVVCGNPNALPNVPAEGFWPQDCAAATQNLLLQATELGVWHLLVRDLPRQRSLDGLREAAGGDDGSLLPDPCGNGGRAARAARVLRPVPCAVSALNGRESDATGSIAHGVYGMQD